MKIHSILIYLFLFLLSGCGMFSSNVIFTPAEGLKDEKFSSRTVPAKVSKESKENLEREGYAHIGYVSSEDIVKTCWDKDCNNFTCSGNPPRRDTTKEVLEKAALQGGDLVILQTDSTLSIKPTSKLGGCTNGHMTFYNEEECTGGYGSIRRECKMVPRQKYTCVSWSTISGQQCRYISSGSIWRHDPELGRRLVGSQREKAIIRREKENKSAQIAAYKKAYEEKGLMFQNDELVSVNIGGKYGFKDRSGKTIIEPQFTDTMHGFSDGVAVVSVGEKDEKKWGVINRSGKWVVRPSYKSMGKPSNGMVNVDVNGKCGYLDTTGRVVIDAQFTTCWQFSEGMAAVRQDMKGKVGYIDKTGKIVIEPQFTLGKPFSGGLAAVLVGGKYGYIDTQGKFIIKAQFNDADPFINGIARVKDGNKERYITKVGEVFMEP